MRHEHTVLFVDDEVNILKALQRLLRSEDMNVLCASRASRGPRARSRTTPLPGRRDRPAHAGDVRRRPALHRSASSHPDVVRMMLTGYTEMNVAVEAINRGEIYRLITKPWNDDELKATIRQAFDQSDLKDEIKRLNQVTREQNFKLQDMNRNLEGKVRERTKQLAEKHQELRTAYVQTIRALAEAVDAKDAYTRGHSERVGVSTPRRSPGDGPPQGVHRARVHRRAAPRRRQDRRARRGHHQAGPAGRGGVRGDQAAPGDRGQDPRAGRLPRRTWPPACATTTSGTTAATGATRTGWPATRSRCPRASSWSPTRWRP